MNGRRRPKPTLSQLDLDNVDDYEMMQSGRRNAARGLLQHGSGTGENVRLMRSGKDAHGNTLCWCGKIMGHYWTGKDEGAPHPREQDHRGRTM